MTDFFASTDALSFLQYTPTDNQRWSTWPATTPSERGPEPRPAWVVTSAAACDTELGVLKTGKEADVFLIERGVPDSGPSVLLAAKRYRSSEHRAFSRSDAYRQGRRTRDSREARAMASNSTFGRHVAETQWARAEFDALCRLHELGTPVPYPVQLQGTELLMEFLGTGREAAPRLAQTRADLDDRFTEVVGIMHSFAAAGFAHGDFSPYNLLVHEGRVRVIDVPQIVDIVTNPQGLDLLHRDCVTVCTWFARQRVEADAEALFADLVATAFA